MHKIAIAICTHNRAAALKRTLQSLTYLAIPTNATHRIFLVANACTDDTLAVVLTFADLLPLVSCVEHQPGLSVARNTALNMIEGWNPDLVIWCDDDVLVRRDWISAYWDAFLSESDIDVLGGPIDPVFEEAPPPWIVGGLSIFGFAFAGLDYGNTQKLLPLGTRGPVGANMAFRYSSVQGLRFDPALGVTPTRRLGGEENDYIARAIKKSGRWAYVAAARVQHCIPINRTSKQYLSNYYRAVGHSFVLSGQVSANDFNLFGKPRWIFRVLLFTWFRRMYLAILFPRSERFARAFEDSETAIGILEAYGQQGPRSDVNQVR